MFLLERFLECPGDLMFILNYQYTHGMFLLYGVIEERDYEYLLDHECIWVRIGIRSRPLSVSSYSQRAADVGRLTIIPSCSSLTKRAESVRGFISPVMSCSWQNRTVGSAKKNRSSRGVHLSPMMSVAASTDPICVFMFQTIHCLAYFVKAMSTLYTYTDEIDAPPFRP